MPALNQALMTHKDCVADKHIVVIQSISHGLTSPPRSTKVHLPIVTCHNEHIFSKLQLKCKCHGLHFLQCFNRISLFIYLDRPDNDKYIASLDVSGNWLKKNAQWKIKEIIKAQL